MLMEQATVVRKEWSAVCDSVIHNKPKIIKRTRDKMWFSNLETMSEILQAYQFTAVKYIEDDGSVTLSLNEIDLIENGRDEEEARLNLARSILEYSLIIMKSTSCIPAVPIEKSIFLIFLKQSSWRIRKK